MGITKGFKYYIRYTSVILEVVTKDGNDYLTSRLGFSLPMYKKQRDYLIISIR